MKPKMPARDMREYRKKQGIQMTDPLWWAIETTARIDEFIEALRSREQYERAVSEGSVKRIWYFQEWVPQDPLKFDYVGRSRPGTFHHKISAVSREEAILLMTEKLRKERNLDRSEASGTTDTEVQTPSEVVEPSEDTTDKAA